MGSRKKTTFSNMSNETSRKARSLAACKKGKQNNIISDKEKNNRKQRLKQWREWWG